MTRLKSVGYYSESLNNGVDYAIREDGAVFVRETSYSKRFNCPVTTKWKRDSHWDQTFAGLPSSVAVGFASRGQHKFFSNTNLRLPQEI